MAQDRVGAVGLVRQAKSGAAAAVRFGSVDVTDADRTFQTTAGVIDSGLSDLAAAGNHVTVRIDVTNRSGF